MLREYIATFHSHFGAARFHKEKVKEGKKAYLQPVPRDLSSSCGTAVHFYVEDNGKSEPLSIKDPHGEIEQIVEIVGHSYKVCYAPLE
ncbi:hypothetical protein HMPREF9624_01190 [Oribacterium asaccharolyticum ACB7]|jgi:conserved hypothetical protein|uniref:Putative Se/S carrier protein-like domain-containing protein n=1 Tax=Oribacterium asaccharolyticum ACB7 TaxID=796944 RepID=G9WWA6_9FIRM|nr:MULTISPECIES: DUF3343 domain-containing protein [Oribacterium]EGL37479.1 hypothetical protein HMPREF9124_2031 [Oribacterium sp. oral taxon 108 str. F0425]EHL10512.1 hypothetical protein HMPREF9624_01190 [Oribacterium asaccharolyticum ACB7]